MLKNQKRLILLILVLIASLVSLEIILFQNYRAKQISQRLTLDQSWVLVSEVQLEECAELEVREEVRCIISSALVSRKKEMAEYDLIAQQDMASWALVVLMLSTLSLLVSMGGLLALICTFRETRRLNEIERAYLIGEKFIVAKIWDAEDPSFYQLDVGFEVRNSGSTPAFDMTIVSRLGWNTLDKMLDWAPNSSPTSRGILGPGQLIHQSRPLPVNFQDWSVADNIENGATVWARGVVRYRDIYDQWWEHTFMWKVKDPEKLLNSRVAQPDDKKFLEFGLTVYETLNDLRKIKAPE